MIIGSYIKKIRSEKGFTLNEVAKSTNLTASLLSQIENDKTSPSLGSLETLLAFYKVPISDFFKQVEQKNVIYLSADETETIENEEMGVKLALLASKIEHNTFETYRVEMKHGAHADLHKFDRSVNGERFIYILNGELNVMLEEGEFHMKHGDSITFRNDIPCKLVNKSSHSTAVFLITGAPPNFDIKFRDKFLVTGKKI